MDGIFRRHSEVGKRVRDIEKSLSEIDSEMRALSRELHKEEKKSMPKRRPESDPGKNIPVGETGSGLWHKTDERNQSVKAESPRLSHEAGAAQNEIRHGGDVARDKKLITYLMSKDFQPSRPLKYQRRIQRNRAIMILVVAGLVLIWLLGYLYS